MIIVLKNNTSREKTKELCDYLTKNYNVTTNPIIGENTTVIGLVGDTSSIDYKSIDYLACVEKVMKVQEPFKKANRKFHPDDTIVKVGDTLIGGEKIVLMAGPCAVESEEQICSIAEEIKDFDTSILRGGAFKPRTSPYSFQGLKEEGLKLLKKAKEKTGLPIISEITNPRDVDLFMEYVDIIQVGARNMQNFELLKELGAVRKPVLLKRGFSNTLEDFLMSAEYIMSGGNDDVILCERGIRTFENSMRNTLDISAVPYLKKKSHLPVVVDPSHASGITWMVEPLAKASIAVGCDGLIIEVHNDPLNALSDGPQSLLPEKYKQVVDSLKDVAKAVGRKI